MASSGPAGTAVAAISAPIDRARPVGRTVVRPDATGSERGIGAAAARRAAWSRDSSTRKAAPEPVTTPPPSMPWRSQTGVHGAAMQIAAELVGEQHVGMLGLEGAADQHMRRLPGADARRRRLDRRDAGAFLAHEGARRAGHLVDDGDVAGEQVGELRQEKRRAQLGGQLLVEQHVAVVAAWPTRRGWPGRPPRRARRRRPPRSCPSVAQSASSPLMPASSSASPAA